MRRYGMLFVAALLVGLVLVAFGRGVVGPSRTVARAMPAPIATLEIAIEDGGLTPDALAVPKGHRVVLTIVNRSGHEHELALAGYEDRLTISRIAASGEWRGEFLADRPGEDFAWLLDGRPAGRLSVQGSHLVEGHR